MARLSSHPLPPAALSRPALRYIYETTPPTPRVGPVAPRSAGRPPKPLHRAPANADLPPLEEAIIFGDRYQIEGPLDSGGTATIWLTRDLTSGKQRALKLLNENAAKDPILRGCFLAGARAAMGVHHPNVVRVLSVHEPNAARPFAVMELLRGEPLNATLAREIRLAPELVVSLARGAARGLAAAHEKGLVHCDVKPENLFVIQHGGEPALKLLDFDLAFIHDREEKPAEDGRVMLRGTAKYMAPEQIVGDRVDARTDVYGLGVVLFRLLTGHVPFDLDLSTTLLRHHLSSPVPPPSWLVDELDPRLDALVVRATRKDPANRYQDMTSLLADLDAIALDVDFPEPHSSPAVDRYTPQSDQAREAVRALESAA